MRKIAMCVVTWTQSSTSVYCKHATYRMISILIYRWIKSKRFYILVYRSTADPNFVNFQRKCHIIA